MKKINLKKSLICALAAVTFLTACTDGKSAGATIKDVEFWSTYSTEKVIQDNVEIYEDIKREAKINVTAIRGEQEAQQIIMTTGKNAVSSYDVVLSDLVGENGAIFKKDDIKVYHEIYIEVGAASEYYTEAGFYPDCLAPFEGVKAAGENCIAKNNNQGLYISFDVPENQPAGIYTGSFDIKIGGGVKTIPVTLEVAPVTIGVETHVASSFLNEWYFYRGELDTTEDMFDKYNKMLFDYRLGCNDVTTYVDDVDYYAEKVCEYAALPECPGYNIPWFSKNYENSGYELNGRVLNVKHSYDVDKLLTYFRAIAEKGLQKGVDPFAKALVYGWDEPDLGFGTATAAIYVKEWSYIVKQCKNIVIEELEDLTVTADKQQLKETIIKSLDDLPHLVLSNNFLNMELDLEQEEITYGPYFSALGSAAARDMYRLKEGNDLWWYGCTTPRSPFPTYHIDDTVLSARLESWMKADYDIQGNLYWSTCLYSEPSVNEAMVYPENFYTGNAARSLGVYGEGFLLYPGKKYGVDGPLSSIRLEHIRDGLEEYEMIYSLKKIYGEVGESIGETVSEDVFMNYLYSKLYTGVKVQTTAETFEAMREILVDLTALAQSDAKVCVVDVNEGAGKYVFDVFAKDGYNLTQAGVNVTSKRAVNGGNVYTVTVAVSDGESLDLAVEVGGKTLPLKMDWGSGSVTYYATDVFNANAITKRNIEVATELVDAKAVNSEAREDEKYIKLTLGEATSAAQDFLITCDMIKSIGKKDDKLVIQLYNTGKYVAAELMIKHGNDGSYVTKETVNLETGMNSLSLNNLYGYNWDKIKFIENVRIKIGAKGDAARDSIYFVSMALYKS